MPSSNFTQGVSKDRPSRLELQLRRDGVVHVYCAPRAAPIVTIPHAGEDLLSLFQLPEFKHMKTLSFPVDMENSSCLV